MLTYMGHSSDLGYITIVKNQAKLNSEWTQDGNSDLHAEGDLPNTRTPHTQNKVMCVCEIPTVLKSTTAGCLQNNKAGPCYFHLHPALFSPASSSRHSEREHQITSDAGRGVRSTGLQDWLPVSKAIICKAEELLVRRSDEKREEL